MNRVRLNPDTDECGVLLLWLKGWVLDWYFNTDQTVSKDKFRDHFERVYTTVYEYLRGNKKLDGSCSDLECLAADRAYDVFKDIFTRME